MSADSFKVSYAWQPIEPLTEQDRAIDITTVSSLMDVWKTIKTTWKQDNIKEFTNRLIRRFSIETGILERLYDLNMGATETLVAQGFVDSLLRHGDSTLGSASLIRILKDHESAITHVMDGIVGQRQLSKSFIHELHRLLVENQGTVEAIDQFGFQRQVALLKGQYKQHPNNPTRRDGLLHEYCPPIHVESEMERLLEWTNAYQNENPIVLAAWLHHRFTQIHPYQDGNGRLARTLMNYVLLKADVLPIVIQGDNQNRTEYIHALEQADLGNLEPLVQLFARLEQVAITQALSFEIPSQSTTDSVFEALREKLLQKTQTQHLLRAVNDVALMARDLAALQLKQLVEQLTRMLPNPIVSSVELGGNDLNTGHWFQYQIAQVAKENQTFINLSENKYFVKVTVQIQQEQLIFVIVWHHIGRALSGIMQAVAFAEFAPLELDVPEQEKMTLNTSAEPYLFTYTMTSESINGAFLEWIDSNFAVAIKALTERL